MEIDRKRKRKHSEEEINDPGTQSAVDRISQLPDHLVHRILSFLPAKYAIRASTLSKVWNQLYSTFPTLDFHLYYTEPIEDYSLNQVTNKLAAEEEFLNLADGSLRRRLQRILNPCKFRIHVFFPSLNLLAPYMDRWVATAVKRNVQNLDFEVSTEGLIQYSVPQTLLSAKFLTVLRLAGCKLDWECDIQLVQLRKLCLKDVDFPGEGMFQNLILKCPLVEALVLEECELRILRLVPSLIQLKQVHVIRCYLESIEVLVPNLLTFQLMKSSSRKIKFASIKNLKLQDCDMSEEQFQNLMSELLPILEVLELHDCSCLRKINIPSQKLKGLILQRTKLTHVDIDTPNLLSFQLTSYEFPTISMNSLNLLKQVRIQFWLGSHEILQLAKLKDVLVKSSHSEDFKFLVHYSPLNTTMIHEKLSEVQLSPLCNLEDPCNNIFLCITSMSCADLLNEMVCPWRPKTLSVVCSYNKSTEEEFLLVKSMDGIGADDYLWPSWKFFLKSHSTTQYQATTIWYHERLQRNRSNRSHYESSVWEVLSAWHYG